MKRGFVLVILAGWVLWPRARAVAQDDQYVRIYNLIQEADTLKSSRQPEKALAKYLEAQSSLQQLQKLYPAWNNKIVSFRLNYLASRIAEIPAQTPAPAPVRAAARSEINKPPVVPVQPGDRGDVDNQVNALQNVVRQLQADNMVLQAKLKEALSALPAAVDPRELANAEERIRSIEKENALLKVSLTQQQARTPSAIDTNTLDRMQRELEDANRRLAAQTEIANALALDKKTLQTRLSSLIPAAWNATNLEASRKAMEETNRRLAEQTELASKLAREKESLLARVKTLEADAEAMAALHAENELLKKQLADLKPSSSGASTGDADRQLAEARAEIAALQSDKEILRIEKIALQDRVKELAAPPIAASLLPPSGWPADAERVKRLERERADLEKKLEAARKEIYGRKGKGAAARIEDLNGQLEVLRARLGVFEAQQVPYAPEELALLKKSEPSLAPANSRAGQKPVRDLPAGTATLVAEAQRDFAAKRFDKAEEKYLETLRKDDKNVYALANLATIQLELNRVDDAEKHIHQALALAPDDAYSLLVLGEIQFRREDYNQALDALSRAARLDPQNSEIQNFLGLTLSQKGMRNPAETAFRKAIQLSPDYASAHNNLAVLYLTQKPPWVELARWHYKKALAAGSPHNPDLEKLLLPDKKTEPDP